MNKKKEELLKKKKRIIKEITYEEIALSIMQNIDILYKKDNQPKLKRVKN